jgi:hypothetical protein
MKKYDRQKVYNKFGGLCAYTGKPLGEDWQVDHITPVKYFVWRQSKTDPNCLDNLVPCLRRLNHYKRCKDLEEWRHYILTLHLRLAKLLKKTRVKRTESRKVYLLDVAEAFGITAEKPFNGLFYFETLKQQS